MGLKGFCELVLGSLLKVLGSLGMSPISARASFHALVIQSEETSRKSSCCDMV